MQTPAGKRKKAWTIHSVMGLCFYAMHVADGEGKAQTCSPPSGTRPVSGATGTQGIRGGDNPVFPGPACILVLLHF